MLVVLEGLPGAGKSTVLRKLAELDGVNVIDEVVGKEPSDAGVDFFLNNDISKHKQIMPGKANVMDRNYTSTLCFFYCIDHQYGTNLDRRVSKACTTALK